MGLNPHLINLMSVRERQSLAAVKSSTTTDAVGSRSFTKSFKEAFAVASARLADVSEVSAKLEIARGELARENLEIPQLRADRRMSPAQVMSPERLLKEFLSGQDVALVGHQMPGGRYRTNPDDDTSDEAGTQANLRPIE